MNTRSVLGSESPAELLQHAISVARDAGAILRDGFGQPHDIVYKGPLDLVTEVDRAAEALITEQIRALFPRHGIQGEEGSQIDADGSPICWVIDPLDGTTNFAHGLAGFAVSIGVERDGDVIAGVVYDPIREELFAAASDVASSLNGAPIHVSATPILQRSLLATGFSSHLPLRAIQASLWCEILPHVRAVRQLGSAALQLCYIAAGRIDGYWEHRLSPWDIAAGSLIVIQAGGSVTSTSGASFDARRGDVLASNGMIHEELRLLLDQHQDDLLCLESGG